MALKLMLWQGSGLGTSAYSGADNVGEHDQVQATLPGTKRELFCWQVNDGRG
jgi:hypothetical protein